MVAHRSPPAQHLLRNNADIRLVFKEGRRSSGPFFTLLYRGNALERTRVGVVVGKKLGGAVQRNRCKRRFRELARRSINRIPAGWDLVVLPKRECGDALPLRLKLAWQEGLARAGLFQPDDAS